VQKQGNYNFILSPAFVHGEGNDACGCQPVKGEPTGYGKSYHSDQPSAGTFNSQGNGNYADADIDQDNDAWQKQSAIQDSVVMTLPHGPNGSKGYDKQDGAKGPGSQSVKGGDQDITQTNTGSITQAQGNGNFNLSPAFLIDKGEATDAVAAAARATPRRAATMTQALPPRTSRATVTTPMPTSTRTTTPGKARKPTSPPLRLPL
jgi:hypothetical protein